MPGTSAAGPASPTRQARSDPSGRVTLVVATRGRAGLLAETLPRHVASLGVQPRERRQQVIVVDNGSDDGTAEVAASHPRVGVVRLSRNIGAAARTVGAARAGTRYVAFSDDDSWWDPGALAGACDVLDRHPGVALVTGSVRVGVHGGNDPIDRVLREGPATVGGWSVRGFLACAAVMRRDVFLSAGGFPPELGVGGEEEWLVHRLTEAGWELVYRPELVVRHRPEKAGPRHGRRVTQARNAVALALVRGAPRSALRAARRLPPEIRFRTIADLMAAVPWILRNRGTRESPPRG